MARIIWINLLTLALVANAAMAQEIDGTTEPIKVKVGEVKMVSVMLNIADRSSNAKVKSKVVIRNTKTNETIEVEGNQVVQLRAGDRYEVEVTSDQGYAFNTGVIDLTGDVENLPGNTQTLKGNDQTLTASVQTIASGNTGTAKTMNAKGDTSNPESTAPTAEDKTNGITGSASINTPGKQDDNTAASAGQQIVAASLDINLMKLEKNATQELKDIVFESNSTRLTEASYKELQHVTRMIQTNPSLKIQIDAHTDDVGGEQENLALSNKRAKIVMDYLLQNKVPADRLSYKGYGESMPKFKNDTPEHRALNRRVEIRVTEI